MFKDDCKAIKNIENDNTKKLIGEIDTDAIENLSIESLYYVFPLIERIVVEIYKLLPLKDVEQYRQGYMRTVISILDKDDNTIFPQQVIDSLNRYYGDTGLRNKLLHGNDDVGHFVITSNDLDYDELINILKELLIILKDSCEKYTIEDLGKIEKIE